ncbi:ROK family protein [Streptomyces javensis]|uniref:ROK family protein n=1 Tax=Streptomyces javensis TaxID=114698 RepID=UPI003F4D5167
MTAKARTAQPSLRTTVRDPRHGSRSSLLWTLYPHAPLSRQELVSRTGLGATTVGWDGVPLERLLRTGTALPLHIDNGAAALGRAEMWFGAGRGVQHGVVALIGSGVSASVITHGSPHRGATGSAGEWGHTTVQAGGRRCRCGARGCLEAYVGAEAVLERYRQARRGRVTAVALGAAALPVRHFLTEGAHRPARRPAVNPQGALTRPPPVCGPTTTTPRGALARAAPTARMPVP